jgi:hypothetical protein
VKRFVFHISVVLCTVSAPAFAQWGPASTESQWAKPTLDNNGNPIEYDSQGRPVERRLDNNGNPITQTPPPKKVESASVPERTIPGVTPPQSQPVGTSPPCYLEQPFIKRGNTLTGQYAGRCINDRYNGKAVLSLIDQSNKWGDPLIFTVNYKDGKPFGTAMIDSGNGAMIFTGTLKNWQPWNGYTEAFDQNNRPIRFGTRNGQDAPYSQIGQIPVFTAYIPPAELASTQKPKKGGCDADRPTDRYFITGEYPGDCKGGRYTGTAELTLTPKDASQPTIKIKAPFQDGYLSGPVVAKYPQLGITYKGTFDGWRPQDGVSEQPTGDRNFLVKEYRSGVEVSSRSEYRQPSELEVALIGAAGQIGQNLGRKLGREIDGSASQARSARREADSARIAREQTAKANALAEARRIEEQAARQREMTEREQGTGLLTPQVRVAEADIPPTPPVLTTSPPVFGGNTNPQGDPPIATTRPPELPSPQWSPDSRPADTPPALPDPLPPPREGLPSPQSGGGGVSEPPTAPVERPVITPAPPSPAQPVQTPIQNDTISTGQPAPSNPVSQPVVYGPASLSQPASGVNRPAPVPAATQPAALQRPSSPTGLYPTNPNPLAQPIPLGWGQVTGATYYILTVKDQAGRFPVDEVRVAQTTYPLPMLAAGQSFTWDVQACNQAGCSPRSHNGMFRTGGGIASSVTCDASLTPNQEAIVREYVEATGQPRPRDSAICLWKRNGTFISNLQSLSNQAVEARRSNRSFWEIPISERHAAGIRAISTSPDVRKKISDLYEEVAKEVATGDLRSKLPPNVDFAVDVGSYLQEALSIYAKNKTEKSLMQAASTINLIASFTSDQISKKYGVPIGPSKLINLSGTAIGVYATSFFNSN